MQIVQNDGTKRNVVIEKFPALDGWDIQEKFLTFAASTDKVFRRAFTLEVLSYAKVMIDTNEYPLTTDALIDNHLQKWENVKEVFEQVLRENGIDPETHADKPRFWAQAGAEMAISFMAEITSLIGPALKFDATK